MQINKALIVGGAGFIGTHLAKYLFDKNPEITVVSLDIAAPERAVDGVDYRTHDIRTPLVDVMQDEFDIVYNLAAIHRTPGHADSEYFATNIAGAVNVTDYCKKMAIKTIVFTSSIATYGPNEASLDETAPLTPNSAYGSSKALAEQIHLSWQDRDRENSLVIVRPAVVFGTGENGNFTRLARLLSRGNLIYPGRSDTKKACGYVKELPHTMQFALERRQPVYVYNFANPDCPTIKEICEIFTAVSSARPPRGKMPLMFLEVGALPFEVLNALGVKNGINRSRIRKLVHSTNIHPGRLIRDGYEPTYDLKSALTDWIAEDPSLNLHLLQ